MWLVGNRFVDLVADQQQVAALHEFCDLLEFGFPKHASDGVPRGVDEQQSGGGRGCGFQGFNGQFEPLPAIRESTREGRPPARRMGDW